MTGACHLPGDQLSVRRRRKTVPLPGWQRILQRLARQREQQERIAMLVFIDDVEVHRESTTGPATTAPRQGRVVARLQPLHLSVAFPVKRRLDAIGTLPFQAGCREGCLAIASGVITTVRLSAGRRRSLQDPRHCHRRDTNNQHHVTQRAGSLFQSNRYGAGTGTGSERDGLGESAGASTRASAASSSPALPYLSSGCSAVARSTTLIKPSGKSGRTSRNGLRRSDRSCSRSISVRESPSTGYYPVTRK